MYQLGFADHIWLRYQYTRAKLLTIEHRLETEFFSPEFMDMLRKGNVFAEWKNSETAKFFEDHGYKNKKESSGYFF